MEYKFECVLMKICNEVRMKNLCKMTIRTNFHVCIKHGMMT